MKTTYYLLRFVIFKSDFTEKFCTFKIKSNFFKNNKFSWMFKLKALHLYFFDSQ